MKQLGEHTSKYSVRDYIYLNRFSVPVPREWYKKHILYKRETAHGGYTTAAVDYNEYHFTGTVIVNIH